MTKFVFWCYVFILFFFHATANLRKSIMNCLSTRIPFLHRKLLTWLLLPSNVPLCIKRLIAEIAWGKNVVETTDEHWINVCHMTKRRALHYSCQSGHMAIAEWALTTEKQLQSETLNTALRAACYGGHLTIAQWLLTLGASELSDAFESACANDQLEIAKWLHTKTANLHGALCNVSYYKCPSIEQWIVEENKLPLWEINLYIL